MPPINYRSLIGLGRQVIVFPNTHLRQNSWVHPIRELPTVFSTQVGQIDDMMTMTTKRWNIARLDIQCYNVANGDLPILGNGHLIDIKLPLFLWFTKMIDNYHGVIISQTDLE
jgi:hypothetical protein